jgi:F-type H+-transporting ATPase subunit gamma
MKLVAAARLRRAQQRILELRPYAIKTMEVLSQVAARAGEEEEIHPLLARRDPKRVLLVVLSSDRGLAGAFNTNINKTAFRFWKELEAKGIEVSFAVIGRRGKDFVRRRGANIPHEFLGIFEHLSLDKASEIGRAIIHEYVRNPEDPDSLPNLDAVYLIYNEFKSAMTQKVVVEPLLPITPVTLGENDSAMDFEYEPSKKALLDTLLPMYVDVEVYRALLESVASEHGARMTAMEAATNNARDMMDRLTLEFNRARQAAITKELMEIIGGAEALRA